MSYTLLLEEWIRLIAVALGFLAIYLPLLRLWRNRSTYLRQTSGKLISWSRWSAVFFLTIIYLAIGILFWKPIPLEISPDLQRLLIFAGSGFYFPGILLYLWGFKNLGSMYAVSSATSAQLYQGHQLIENGPYSFVRHPMYLAVIMVAIGALLIFQTWAMVLFTPSAFVVILRARREEQLLAREFGASWADYCRRVPAWLPRLKRW